jgi:hypothetical protein
MSGGGTGWTRGCHPLEAKGGGHVPDAQITDLYEVSMAHSYLREGMTGPATFSLFVRKLPPDRGFLMAAGVESALDFLARFEVGPEDVAAFAAALHRPYGQGELAHLIGMRFTGDVRAVPEGRVVLAGEPLLEVTAPLPQAQLIETYLLNQVSHQTAMASKAARCMLAAAGCPVVDFSLRRTHGVEAGEQAARLGRWRASPAPAMLRRPANTANTAWPRSARWPAPTWRRSPTRRRPSGPSPAPTRVRSRCWSTHTTPSMGTHRRPGAA